MKRDAFLQRIICAGGVWTPVLLHKLGVRDSDLWPYCGQAQGLLDHLWWVCSAFENIRASYPLLQQVHFADVHPVIRSYGLPPAMSAAADTTFWGAQPMQGLHTRTAVVGVDPSLQALLSAHAPVLPRLARQIAESIRRPHEALPVYQGPKLQSTSEGHSHLVFTVASVVNPYVPPLAHGGIAVWHAQRSVVVHPLNEIGRASCSIGLVLVIWGCGVILLVKCRSLLGESC